MTGEIHIKCYIVIDILEEQSLGFLDTTFQWLPVQNRQLRCKCLIKHFFVQQLSHVSVILVS